MFSRRLQAVVNMDPKYMARYDGSEQAAGRGSGLTEPPPYEQEKDGKSKRVVANPGRKVATPYEQMTFAPLERRLDIAIFRALFASSARQARQMVVHGAVTVNGKKACIHATNHHYGISAIILYRHPLPLPPILLIRR